MTRDEPRLSGMGWISVESQVAFKYVALSLTSSPNEVHKTKVSMTANKIGVFHLQILDAVYQQVLSQTRSQYEALVQVNESGRPALEASLRTDMDQIITSKEHVTGKIRGKHPTPARRRGPLTNQYVVLFKNV